MVGTELAAAPRGDAIDHSLWFGPVLIGLVTAGGAALLLYLAPNFDNAWLQEAARRVFVEGGSFQRDALEVNPPLAVAIFAPSAWIEHWTGLNADRVYQIGFLLVAALGALAARPTLRWLLDSPLRGDVAAAAALAIQVFGATTLFGERDPMALLLAWPFIIWWCGKLAGRPAARVSALSLAAAIMAGVGFLLKPTTALVPAALILAWAIRQRRFMALFDIHFVAMLGVAGVYAMAATTVLADWLPVGQLGVRVYWAYVSTLPLVLKTSVPEFVLIALLAGLALLLPVTSKVRHVALMLALCALGFQISMIVQMKAWVYHGVPARHLASIGLALIALGGAPAGPGLWRSVRRVVILTAGISGACYSLLVGGRLIGWPIPQSFVSGLGAQELRESDFGRHMIRAAGYGPLVVLSTSLLPTWPSVSMARAEWASRGPCDWIAPAVLQLQNGTPAQRAEAKALHAIGAGYLAEDLERWKPATVVLRATPPRGFRTPGNLIAFYESDPRVRTAWQAYRLEKKHGIWAYYVRRGSRADHAGAFAF